ncbi:hypothetical protein PVK06_042854 [Gossypium arboreum]|uniref:Biogenesis of lysosome-related organelles complex 1 subunit 2 n=1 Tax=Gossypium arboreum TaxID=29729 RepID=A0ABR0MLY1_GOSAR|nr:hypothetical protein PVK06_042854 [Gossypium arboreum]
MADKEPEVQDDLAESLNDLFTSLSSMVKSELQGTNNVLELLEKMNLRVAQEYKGFGDVASGLSVFVEQLKNKSGNFDEYVQQIDAIEQQVTEFEAVISVLDRYVSLLESKVCSSDALQRLLQYVVFVLCMLNLVGLLEADRNCFDDQRILVKVELRAMAIAWRNKENSCPWRLWKSFEELGQIRETARGCLLVGDF